MAFVGLAEELERGKKKRYPRVQREYRWPTPVACTSDPTCPARAWTSHGRQRIANRALYKHGIGTPGLDLDDLESYRKWQLPVALTEWVMGFPRGWTEL
jgi:hypothetical protein